MKSTIARVVVFFLLLGLSVFALAQEKKEEKSARSWTSTFDGYSGKVELVAPMDGALEQLVATHLRAWVACDPEAYLPTVGGYIEERLGGTTTAEDMRSGLEVRYPGNPIVRVTVLQVRRVGEDAAQVEYSARHQDGLEVKRVLHLQVESGEWRVHRVSRAN